MRFHPAKRLLTTCLIATPAILAVGIAHGQGLDDCPDSTLLGTLANQIPDTCTANLPPFQFSTAHSPGPIVVEGPYEMTDVALQDNYAEAPRELFMAMQIQLPGQQDPTIIKDIAYDTGNGVGYRPIPVCDSGTLTAPDGSTKKCWEVMDKFIRESQGLGPNDPIAVAIEYCHPESWNSEGLEALMSDELGTERKCTHLGLYLGKGKTINSPEDYHEKQWWDTGSDTSYPPNIISVSLKGVKQAVFNQSVLNKAYTLNDGVKFPPNYKDAPYKPTSLKIMFEYYRDWLRNENYLRGPNADNAWKKYCAAHQSVIFTMGQHLPDHEEYFIKVYGAEGAALFKTHKKALTTLTGSFKPTYFTPLWESDPDFTVPASVAVIDAPDAAIEGKGFMVPPAATSDILSGTIATYVPTFRVGGVTTAAMIMSFKDTADKRMGLNDVTITSPLVKVDDGFLNYAMPVINKIQVADAMATKGLDSADKIKKWAEKRTMELFVGYGGKQELIPAVQRALGTAGVRQRGLINAKALGMALAQSGMPPDVAQKVAGAWALADGSTKALRGAKSSDVEDVIRCHGMTRENAYRYLRSKIAPILTKAHYQEVSAGSTERYWPPSNLRRGIDGQMPLHPNVAAFIIATGFDAYELKLKRGGPRKLEPDTRPKDAFPGVAREGSIGTP